MKSLARSPFALGTLCVVLAIIATAVLLGPPAAEQVETGRSAIDPVNGQSTPSSTEAPSREAGDPDEEIPTAAPALGRIDPDADNSRAFIAPERPDDGGPTAQAGAVNAVPRRSDDLWDDSSAAAATSSTSPLRTPTSTLPTTTTSTSQNPVTTPSSDNSATTKLRSSSSTTTVTPTTAPATKDTPRVTKPAVETTTTSTTTTTTTTTSTTAAPTTVAPTTAPPTPKPVGTKGRAGYIAPTAPTYIPVYDTAWQMLVRSTPAQADNYFAALKANGFTGTWSGIIHHAPATYNLNFAGGGQVGSMQNGQLVLNDAYVAHVRQILDSANRHGMKVGLVAAWQNLYLPGGGADNGVGTSNSVRGSITTANAHAYGRHIAEEFGDHPAVSMWVFGGDAGTNNTNANKAVWREMARGVRDTGNALSITYHTPTSEFDQLNYAGEPWLDFISPETGHAQDAATTESELRSVKSAYGIPVWQGEARYFNINFDWVNAAFRNPGVSEVQSDAQAAENAGVSGYVYGDAGRWTWCAGYGDSTPCNANNVAASFGAGEAAVIEVFSN